MGRELEFRMERADLVKVGDQVSLKEDVARTMSGTVYYYTIMNAIAMSNNVKDRLESLSGTVNKVVSEEGVYTVTVEIDTQK